MGLTSTLEGIVLGHKYNAEKHKISLVKRDGNVLISTKIGTITAHSVNGKLRLQDNGPHNSWNTNINDHIETFKKYITKTEPITSTIKDRIICFGTLDKDYSNTYTYPNISISRLDELYSKGYRYFLSTLEEHSTDEIMKWIASHNETRWILLKIKYGTVLPFNAISYDHRWYMLDILESEFPGMCSLINRPEEHQSNKPVVLCNFACEDDWNRLEYKKGHYYWSVNPTKSHHNSIRVFEGTSTLINDAIEVLKYYSIHQNKPKSTSLGTYHVDDKNNRRFEVFTKYVVHNGDEINSYIIHCPYTK